MKKTTVIVLSFLFLGALSLILDMPYYWNDSMGESTLWKEIASGVFTVFFIAFLVFSLMRKDRNAIKGLWIYSIVCLVGCIPFFPWFVITGLGLFQPAFSFLGRLVTGAESDTIGVAGPIGLIFITAVSTWILLSVTPLKEKAIDEKADNADKALEVK